MHSALTNICPHQNRGGRGTAGNREKRELMIAGRLG